MFAGLGMVLGIGYSLWLCNRIAFGNSKQFSILKFRDSRDLFAVVGIGKNLILGDDRIEGAEW